MKELHLTEANFLRNHPYNVLRSTGINIIDPSQFPKNLCTLKCEREEGIFYSKVPFLCIVTDFRFPSQCALEVLTPYICVSKSIIESEEYDVGYGWQDANFNWVDNLFQPVHGLDYDDRKVVGWIVL